MIHTNKDRAAWAEAGIKAHHAAVGGDGIDGSEVFVRDLLADLMHYCYLNGLGFDAELDAARDFYQDEGES